MTDAKEDAAHRAWEAYVQEVSDASAGREVEIIRARASDWTSVGRGVFKCRSPLREEKTASFYVYPGRGWFDFGTQEGGNLLQFIQKFYNSSWRDAVDLLARELNLDDWDTRKAKFKGHGPIEDPESLLRRWKEGDPAARMFSASTWLAHLCHELMPTMVREHLRNHYGYADWFIDLQKVGFVPSDLWEIVHSTDAACTYTDAELLSTSWFHKRREDVTPSLVGRIVFPYWKEGQCRYAIGREFFGRASRRDVSPAFYEANPHEQGKYKKLPVHSEKFPWVSEHLRNDVLWGEDCLPRIRDGVLMIAEGVTDAGILAMLGFNVISPVTVAFRDQDVVRVLALLKRYRIKRVVICNDNDTTPDGKHPGLEGAKRMSVALWKAGVDARIARLPKADAVAKTDINELVTAALKGEMAA